MAAHEKTALTWAAVERAITARLRPGVLAGELPDGETLREELARGTLTLADTPAVLLLFRRRSGFSRVSYFLTDPQGACPCVWPDRCVLEVPLRPGAPETAVDYWQTQGFQTVFRRIRRRRTASEETAQEPPPRPVAASEAQALLEACFDPMTGCLPRQEQLEQRSREGLLLSRCADDGTLQALLDVEPRRGAVELRHLAVLPAFRGRGLGVSLTAEFVRRFGSSRCLVWHRQDDAAAAAIYEKNGFHPDGWQSVVLKRERIE